MTNSYTDIKEKKITYTLGLRRPNGSLYADIKGDDGSFSTNDIRGVILVFLKMLMDTGPSENTKEVLTEMYEIIAGTHFHDK